MDQPGRAGKQSLGIEAYTVQKINPRIRDSVEGEKTAFPHKPLYLNEAQNPLWKTEEGLSALPGEVGRLFRA